MKRFKNSDLMLLGAAALAVPAWGDTGQGDYAPSRFGQGPSKSGYGLDAVKPGNEADYWDRTGEPRNPRVPDGPAAHDGEGSGRSPAGLVIGPSANGAATTQAAAMQDPRFDDPDAPVGPPAPRNRIDEAPEMERFAMRKKGVQEVALIAGDLGFFPKTVFVSRDVPVRLFVTGASKNTLCIMMDSFQVRKQIRSQKIEEITFTPSQPGRYRFYCPVNGMEGTLIVKDLVSS